MTKPIIYPNYATARPAQVNDRLYDAEKDIYGTVVDLDKYKDGSNVLIIHTDGGCVGSGHQSIWKEFVLINA